MTTERVSVTVLKKAIIEYVKKSNNLTPSEIFEYMSEAYPKHSSYEIRLLVKELQRDNKLVSDIIYGGLKVA